MSSELKAYGPKDLFNIGEAIAAELSPRWVRVRFAGEFVADSKSTILLREDDRPPVYYFPQEDVRTDLLEKSEKVARFPNLGTTQFWHLARGERRADNSVFSHPEASNDYPYLDDHLAFKWAEMDAWFEEEEQVFVHPRDPYKRVDVLPSSRHVVVELEGVILAESRRPYLLFETGLPTRYYLPWEDVKTELLEESSTQTMCPYKGTAGYFHLRIGERLFEDYVWTYPDPVPECPKIAGLLAFFNERVDIRIDGELQDRPETPWS